MKSIVLSIFNANVEDEVLILSDVIQRTFCTDCFQTVVGRVVLILFVKSMHPFPSSVMCLNNIVFCCCCYSGKFNVQRTTGDPKNVQTSFGA
jgi:hypothetical protein